MATIMAGVGGLCYQPSCLHTARNFHPFCFPKGREGTTTSVALPKPGSFLNSTSLELANKKLRTGVVRLTSPPMATHSSGFGGYLHALPKSGRPISKKWAAGSLPKSTSGPTSLAFTFKEGIIVAAEHQRKFSDEYVPNVFELNSHMLATLSGGSGFLLKDLQEKCRLHECATGRRTSVVEASKWLADTIYSCSEVDVSLGVLIAGWEETDAVLFHVDSKGTVRDCKKMRDSDGMVHDCVIIGIGSDGNFARRALWMSTYYDMSLAEAVFAGKDAICFGERMSHLFMKPPGDCDVVSVYHIGSMGWKKCLSAHDIEEHQKKQIRKYYKYKYKQGESEEDHRKNISRRYCFWDEWDFFLVE